MEAQKIMNRKSAMIIVGGEIITSHDIVITVIMKQDIIMEKLFASYRLFILDNPSLASKWNETVDEAYWSPFTQNELDKLLDLEKAHLSRCHDSSSLYSQYYPTNSRLPFRITMIDSRTLVFSVHHAIANGKSAIAWIERWISFYFYEGNADIKGIPTADVNRSDKIKGSPKTIYNILCTMFYHTRYFAARVLKKYRIMDLSCGIIPRYEKNLGSSVRKYLLSEEDTKDILTRCKYLNMTFGEYSTALLVKGFFDFCSLGDCISLSLAMDVHSYFPQSSLYSIGNFTENAYIQINRHQDVKKAVKSAFHWIRKGVVYGLLIILYNTLLKKFRTIRKAVTKTCMQPFSKRFFLEDLTLAYSPLGIIKEPMLVEKAESVCIYTNCQNIYISSVTFNNRLCFHVSVPNEFFDSNNVYRITDRIFTRDYMISL